MICTTFCIRLDTNPQMVPRLQHNQFYNAQFKVRDNNKSQPHLTFITVYLKKNNQEPFYLQTEQALEC